MNWVNNGKYIVGTNGVVVLDGNSKIAAFDLDGTIIKPTNNKKFSDTDSDWDFYSDNVISKLVNLHKNNYNIVIVTNQNGIGLGKVEYNTWIRKLDKIANILNIPLVVLAGINNDKYRKPNTTLWDEHIKCNIDNSFYCGDAGGLVKRKINNLQIPKDFSDSDLKFALNIGVKFVHRDEFIYDIKQNITVNYPFKFENLKLGKYTFSPNHHEMIIMVGLPGSGKSFYATKYICAHKEYKYINQDILKTSSKCIKMCETELKNNNSVVIDNTNSNKKSRQKYIEIAKKYNIKYKCIKFTTDINLAKHNNYYRNANFDVKLVPDIAYNMYNKYYDEPSLKEGFYIIDSIDFIFDDNFADIDKYKKYYI
jgi:bifunctional polynucleotide phosphatase/kinase